MQSIATSAVVVLAGLIAVLGVATVLWRVARILLDRRRDRLAAAPRRALLAFVAEGGEEGADELLAIPPRAWRAVEPTATAILGKVRGDAHSALAEVFVGMGAADRARTRLRHFDPAVRARSAEILGNLRRADAVGPICQLLDDKQPQVRVVAARALGAIGHPDAAGPLLASLPRPVPAHLVAYSLFRIGTSATPALQAALSHEDPLIRATALEALNLIGATGSVKAVTELLDGEQNLNVRLAAVNALGKLGGRSAVAPLLASTDRAHPPALRVAAVRALGDMGAQVTGDALAMLVADPVQQVAHEAAQALRRLGPAGQARLRGLARIGDAVGDVAKPPEAASPPDSATDDGTVARAGPAPAWTAVGPGTGEPHAAIDLPGAHARQALALMALADPSGNLADLTPTGTIMDGGRPQQGAGD